MSIAQEKKRLIQEIVKYQGGKHDADKMRIAEAVRLTIYTVMTYRELLLVLTTFHSELTMLVGSKNTHRWFKHSAGALTKIMAGGIKRCTPLAANEDMLSKGLNGSKSATTLKDWNRHRGGEAYKVNRKAFALQKPSIPQIKAFLLGAGIMNSKIRDFIADFYNQDGLFAIAHLFPVTTRHATGYFAVAGQGQTHVITSGANSRCVNCRDVYPWEMLISDSSQVRLAPPLNLVCAYELVEAGGKVQVAGTTYALENLTSVPGNLGKKLIASLDLINTFRGD
jgi:hypothetical protein